MSLSLDSGLGSSSDELSLFGVEVDPLYCPVMMGYPSHLEELEGGLQALTEPVANEVVLLPGLVFDTDLVPVLGWGDDFQHRSCQFDCPRA